MVDVYSIYSIAILSYSIGHGFMDFYGGCFKKTSWYSYMAKRCEIPGYSGAMMSNITYDWQGYWTGNSNKHEFFKQESGNFIAHHAAKHSDLSTCIVRFARYDFKQKLHKTSSKPNFSNFPLGRSVFGSSNPDLSGILLSKEMMRRSPSWSSLRSDGRSLDETLTPVMPWPYHYKGMF